MNYLRLFCGFIKKIVEIRAAWSRTGLFLMILRYNILYKGLLHFPQNQEPNLF